MTDRYRSGFWWSQARTHQVAGHAVIKAHADADHQIAIMHRHVALIQAMHANHAEGLLVVRREGTEAHQASV